MNDAIASLLQAQRNSGIAVYLQIANQIILLIRRGVLTTGQQLPGSRELARHLGLQRGTVNAAYEELFVQGWISIQARRGAFVNTSLPEIAPQKLEPRDEGVWPFPEQTAYPIQLQPALQLPVIKGSSQLAFNDGFPDIRHAPVDLLGTTYRSILARGVYRKLLNYSDYFGNESLRNELSVYLNTTRGLNTSAKNILITRGSQMGIFLLAQTLVQAGDKVGVGFTNYRVANASLSYAGAELVPFPVDEFGLDIDAIAAYCRHNSLRALYVTSHHHYPTTVTLSAERRIQLLALAQTHGFAIIEDDYHYDFHYRSGPILPLASADSGGHVAYIGSFSKTIAPAFRLGYLLGPPNLIEAAGRLRRIIDRQGDQILEQAVAELLQSGAIQRHLRKMQRLYHERRDHFCALLDKELSNYLQFTEPSGGLAVWATFDQGLPLEKIALKAAKNGLIMSNGLHHNPPGHQLNATRLGFASLNMEEMETATKILKRTLDGHIVA